jgi:guanidinoacetate N-methyltransferase
MTRRLRRTRDFDVVLQIKNDQFINPPRESQRNWLLNRVLTEVVDDLNHLDTLAKRFVPGVESGMHLHDRYEMVLDDDDIMEDWQLPIMRAMAKIVTETHGDVMEIGFGRGISATFIQEMGVQSHTIIECNDSVVERYQTWKKQYTEQNIRLIHARWQDAIDQLEKYDGIFFHTYPMNEAEYLEQAVNSITFAEHFFPTASAHLKVGGAFTYLTNEIDSFSRAHQRQVLQYFDSVTLSLVEPLDLPEDVTDTWWADSMVVIKAVKGTR